ncbi:DUF296 domain-containing protein [Chryseobacterium sp. C39-AII1]|uniref:PCC domain-containing protein n=1 Tax=Chryseobacterium sp. C39-AII1 TaxID=3080332 RepID=UPI00320A5727
MKIIELLPLNYIHFMDANSFRGDFWSARKIENSYLISIKEKSSLKDALTDFIISQKITTGKIVGVGSIKDVLLRFKNPGTKKHFNVKFNAKNMTANISGSVCNIDESPILELNVTFDEEHYAMAGDLLDAKILNKGEFFLHPLNTQIIYFNNDNDRFLS